MNSNRFATACALGAFALAPIDASALGGETLELLPDDGAASDRFGVSAAVDGITAVVGSSQKDDNGPDSGAAYVFDTLTGLQSFKLLPTDGAAGDLFGFSVAVSGTTAIVGAIHDDEDGAKSGAAYLFDTTTGLQLHKLLPSLGAADDEFGFSVGISGTTAIVGAKSDDNGQDSGCAYLFDTTTGLEITRIVPGDNEAFDFFGASVAISGDVAIVGAYRDGDNGTNSGSAYLFDAATGQELFKLLPNGGQAFTSFGWSVAIDGDTAVVGAVNDSSGSGGGGAAYLFDTVHGQQTARLLANDAGVEDSLGYSVSISGTTAVAGAPFDNTIAGADTGSAYLFDTTTGQQIAKLLASDAADFDALGYTVSISGSTVLAGALFTDDNGDGSGSAYVFDASAGIAVPYCFGSASVGLCPCGNFGLRGRGCANSAFAQGARLYATGSACISNDDLVLNIKSSTPGQPGLLFQGDDALNGGVGFVFGDGLRCAGTQALRLQVATGDVAGNTQSNVALAAAGGLVAGDVRRYQWWYRDPGSSPCGNDFNLSNGVEVTWAP